jgi:hypothetical protein
MTPNEYKPRFNYSILKLITLLVFVLFVILAVSLAKYYKKPENIFALKSRDRHPKLMRRNAMSEEEINKVLKRIKQNLKN